jgi:hypothetical protein
MTKYNIRASGGQTWSVKCYTNNIVVKNSIMKIIDTVNTAWASLFELFVFIIFLIIPKYNILFPRSQTLFISLYELTCLIKGQAIS